MSRATFNQTTSTSRIGTYGQYSIGVAGQVVNTGWLGFVRVDYRNGDNIDGWTGNAGIRYQFTPEMIASVMPVKVKAPPHPFIAPTNWTGFYVGGFAGVAAGRTDVQFRRRSLPACGRPAVGGGWLGRRSRLGYNYQFANTVGRRCRRRYWRHQPAWRTDRRRAGWSCAQRPQ